MRIALGSCFCKTWVKDDLNTGKIAKDGEKSRAKIQKNSGRVKHYVTPLEQLRNNKNGSAIRLETASLT